MNTITLSLPPELYARLHTEAQRQGKAENLLAQEMLADQLQTVVLQEIPLYIQILPRIRDLAATMNMDDFMVPGDVSPDRAITLLRSWSTDDMVDTDEDTESWEDVMRSIDAHRTSNRKLFPHLEQSE